MANTILEFYMDMTFNTSYIGNNRLLEDNQWARLTPKALATFYLLTLVPLFLWSYLKYNDYGDKFSASVGTLLRDSIL
jgi:hypothetical protein